LACMCGGLDVIEFLVQQEFEGINRPLGFGGKTGLEILIEQRFVFDDDELLMPCILLSIEAGAQLDENLVFDELISTILNRIIEITFMKKIILKKWTGRIAQAVTEFTMAPFTKRSLENLQKCLY